VLSAVVEDESDSTAAAAAATPVDASKSQTTTPVPGKRTLKNIKTMFFVGTEVSWLLLCLCLCISHFVLTLNSFQFSLICFMLCYLVHCEALLLVPVFS